MDETDEDRFLYHNSFDISESQNRNACVSKGSNKQSIAFRLFQFCDIKTQRCYILQGEAIISEKISCLVDKLRNFVRISDKSSKYLKILLPKPKIEIKSTKSYDTLFAHYFNDIIEHPNGQTSLSFRFANNNSSIFSIS